MRRNGFLALVAIALLVMTTLSSDVRGGGEAGVNWTSPNAGPTGTDSVQQNQLTASNANNLTLAWTFSFPASSIPPGLNLTGQGAIAPPLVVDGVVYVVMNDLHILAIRASDGGRLWSYWPVLNRTGLPLGILAGHVHGLTYHSGDIWVSLPDCSALALSAADGRVVNRISRICADIPGNAGKYSYSGAPLTFIGDLMVWTASSVSEGTDAGRGFVAAYNITDGKLAWRWYVSPPAGGDASWDMTTCLPPCHGNIQPYAGDWGTLGVFNGKTRAGAGPSWGQPSVDATDGILFLGTSQPSPDWNATYRPGPNLYSDSVIALNVSNGRMLWYYQTTPHDLYDFDCGWNVAVGNVTIRGQNTTAVFKACKNGYVYAFGAKSGTPLWYFDPPSVVRHNTPNADYAKTGIYDGSKSVAGLDTITQCPGINGGVESDIALSGGKVFVASHNFCAYVTPAPVSNVGGSVSGAKTIKYDFINANTTVYALDASEGRELWSYFIAGVPFRGWLTSTGGLVFASLLSGNIIALNSEDGSLAGSTYVGPSLYEGVTVGTDSSGRVLLFQLTSSSAYGGFVTGVPGSLLAFRPGQPRPGISVYLPWVAIGAGLGITTLLLVVLIRRALRTIRLKPAAS
ncbi:MAG TPA: PQQ-binding-like beta-propeller repeat protein [Nitrososphaerales archaeon]|nr:PQQ-binding-like beta-propeller repeat protein [Nitrososphaerales archaeon]